MTETKLLLTGMDFTNFHNEMNALFSHDVTEYDCNRIIAGIQVTDNQTQIITDNGYDTFEELENNAFIVSDVNLHACFENLTDWTEDIQQVLDCYYARYGRCIDVYYNTSLDMYTLVMIER